MFILVCSSSRRLNSFTKMKPPPRCSAWGLWPTRPPLRPHRPAARTAPRWVGAATTAAAALPRPPLSDHQWPRNHAGTTADALQVTSLLPSQILVVSRVLDFNYLTDSCSSQSINWNNNSKTWMRCEAWAALGKDGCLPELFLLEFMTLIWNIFHK